MTTDTDPATRKVRQTFQRNLYGREQQPYGESIEASAIFFPRASPEFSPFKYYKPSASLSLSLFFIYSLLPFLRYAFILHFLVHFDGVCFDAYESVWYRNSFHSIYIVK